MRCPTIKPQLNPFLSSPFSAPYQIWPVQSLGLGLAHVTEEGVFDVVVGEGGRGVMRRSVRGVEGMWRDWLSRQTDKEEEGDGGDDEATDMDEDEMDGVVKTTSAVPDKGAEMRVIILRQSDAIVKLRRELDEARREVRRALRSME